MGFVTGTHRVAALVTAMVLAVSLTGCSGAGDQKGGKDASKSDSTAKPVRWPRYWATEEQAETGAQDDRSTHYFAGYDDASVVYNGQDVLRFLDPATGKANHPEVVLKHSIFCGSQPRRQITQHRALMIVGPSSCKTVIAYDTQTGKQAWAYGFAGDETGPLSVDERDGTVLFVSGTGYVAGLDTVTGDVKWETQASSLVFGEGNGKTARCSAYAALAADRPVIIASLDCGDESAAKGIFGIDLATGKQLWRAKSWVGAQKSGPRPHAIDGRFFPALGEPTAAWVSSKTGKVTKLDLKTPPERLTGSEVVYSRCDDVRSGGTRSPGSDQACVWSNGKTLVLAAAVTEGNRYGIRLEGLNPATGKSLWTWKKKGDYDPAKNEFHAGYGPLGFSEDGKEFLVQANLEGVLRFSAKNGNIVGRATLAPGMNLVQFGVAGPDFLLLRTEGGILDAKSGLSYYRTASS
jgi:outer membrane protein assembly factor BamB